MVTETGSAGLVGRLRAAATAREFGPDRVAGVLADWLSAGSGSLEPELLRRPAGTPWVLTPLHRAPDSSWSVLVAVFVPGERAPVYDHGAWAVIGIVADRERETRFRRGDTGLEVDRTSINPAGVVTIVPAAAIHTVEALDGQDAVSVHGYGTDIVTQPRHTHDPDTGSAGPFRPPFAEPARP